ncbi:carbohydrate sulfotransferase 3-like isoform X2 [Portunus trituberculatus]|nr:carbohydrate sulfotransferase 3-like isoform X2 [Portunus trituberculatus]XP_045107820.1 carbohydrate sulfotransferase 3-like isoform X2 [Portunus trituberculatus]
MVQHSEQDANTQGKELTEEEPRNDRGPPAGPLVVLVLSSMPRGGSTLLTELLSNIPGSVVMFEPLWLIEKTKCYKDLACVQRYLADVFTCSFKENFQTWLKGKGLFFQHFNGQARKCLALKGEEKEACLKGMDLQALCAATPMLVVKVVRARLAWLRNMLEDSLINLKVLHLTRDPRASLRSIATFGWNSEPHSRCAELEDDLLTYEAARQAFPAKVLQVRYERLCLHPQQVIRDLFRFLQDDAAPPAAVTAYVDQHMLSGASRKGTMSTFRNSTEEFQAWRFKINDKQLKVIEAEPACLRAITHMGHATFGSEAAARNTSLPLILNAT